MVIESGHWFSLFCSVTVQKQMCRSARTHFISKMDGARLTPVISVLGKLRKEDCQNFETSLGYKWKKNDIISWSLRVLVRNLFEGSHEDKWPVSTLSCD